MRATGDIGCHPGDAVNHILPWSLDEGLGHFNRTLLQFQTRSMRQCFILVDRHLHKNGGSTVRDLFLEHERQGLATYSGYHHKSWEDDATALRAVATRPAERAENRSQVLLVESHFGDGGPELADQVLPSLRGIARMLSHQQGSACPLVLMTRIREPLDYYLSFYRWAIGFRQRDAPRIYGATFLEWAQLCPNLQSNMMLNSMAAYFAEYHPRAYRRKFASDAGAWRGERRHRTASWRASGAAWRRLRAMLDRFAIVAPLARFDEAMLSLHDLTGLPLLLYKRNRPNQKAFGAAVQLCPALAAVHASGLRLPTRAHLPCTGRLQRPQRGRVP